jgi:ADP-heptose:LPS heptosyltransferase
MLHALSKFLVVNQYPFLNGCINLVKKALFNIPENNITQILIVRKGTLGDIVVALPVIHSVRKLYPNAHIHLLSKHFGSKHIAAHSIIPNDIIQKYIYEDEVTLGSLFHQLKCYDLVIELPQYRDSLYTQLRNMLFYRLAGIRYGAGWEIGSTFFLRKTQLKTITFEKESERLFQRLQADGIQITNNENYALQIDTNVVLPQNKFLAIAIGAKYERKKWPLNSFLQIAQRFNKEGYEVVWIGDKTDGTQLESAGIKHHQCGKLTVAQSAYVLQNAVCALTNDSGPMHLAYALDTPVVALFSARDYPNKWFPPSNKKASIFQHTEVPCAICVGKPCTDNICMKAISVDEVWNQLKTWIC